MIRHTKNYYRVGCGSWWMHWLKSPMYLCQDIRDTWQRGRNGWCSTDCWNLDSYLSTVILETLQHFKEGTQGYPGVFESIDEWYAQLDLMIDGWTAQRELTDENTWDYENVPYDEWAEPLRKRRDVGFASFKEYSGGLWS